MSVIETKTLSALEVYKEKVRNGEIEPIVSKSPKEKWEENKTSLRKSVTWFCMQCMGNESSVRADIRECTAKDCALYEVRPFK